ncbi:hypothetical protein WN943_028623 [Citrus x changshan-huyou]
MKFLDWYLKIAIGAALVGGSMELFMIKTGFCVRTLLSASSLTTRKLNWNCYFPQMQHCTCHWIEKWWMRYPLEKFQLHDRDDKVTVLESEKRAWESSPEAQAIREGLNPWRNRDAETRRNS